MLVSVPTLQPGIPPPPPHYIIIVAGPLDNSYRDFSDKLLKNW